MSAEPEKVTIVMDRLHFQLFVAIAALLLSALVAIDGHAFWERRKNAELRQRVAALEGKMAAVLESIQHGE